jgi:hypothetical protein
MIHRLKFAILRDRPSGLWLTKHRSTCSSDSLRRAPRETRLVSLGPWLKLVDCGRAFGAKPWQLSSDGADVRVGLAVGMETHC